jgi:hypothetical protein
MRIGKGDLLQMWQLLFREPIRINAGESALVLMPYSEVCCHMKVAGEILLIRLEYSGQVQLYDWDDVRQRYVEFSMPILLGEAGVFQDEKGFYTYGCIVEGTGQERKILTPKA